MQLPKTYNFKESEKKWKRFWHSEKIYKFNPKSKKPIFSIDTPPPTLSGYMHLGHAFSYSHEDFIARYFRMKQYHVFFPFGTDDNGLPTERLVENLKKVRSLDLKRDEFIKLCQKTIKDIKHDFIKDWILLGMSCDFDESYSTINDLSIKIAQKSFIDLYKKGYLKRMDIPIIWDTKLRTSLAQADLVDVEKESYFNDVIFKSNGKDLIISTTRPELIPACVALFCHPEDIRYKNLKEKRAKVPLFNYEVPILEDKTVDMNKGTGLMMVCTFGDKDDIEKWAKYRLPLRAVISEDGTLNKDAGKYNKMTVKEARKEIINDLKKHSLLVKQHRIKHVVNVSERSGAEIEFLKSNQWVISLLDHKKELLRQADKIKWYPEFMKLRYKNWVKDLQWDWVISRQRYYGVPFPVWYDKKTGKVVFPKPNELPVDPRNYIPKRYKKSDLIPEMDVMDTWMTSSLTPQINSRWKEKNELKIIPMSLRPQAHDIIRTWAFYTIVKAFYHDKKIPWGDIVISGHVLDSKGKKMSKSLGNVVNPRDVLQKYGADAFRFWSSEASLGKDFSFKEEELKNGLKTVTKLWNASRFSVTHLEDFDNKKVKLNFIDKGILSKFNDLIKEATNAFDKYEYSKSKLLTEKFFWSEICDNYLEIIKDRLYNPGERGIEERKSAQFTLYYLVLNTLKLFAPIMPFITEEIYNLYFNKIEKEKSIHISEWPEYDKKLKDKLSEKIWNRFVEILGKVRGVKAKNKKSLKHEIILTITEDDRRLLKHVLDDLKAVTNAKEILFGKFKITI